MVGVLVYLPSFSNPFIWDDEQFIVKNVYTSSLAHVGRIFVSNTTEGAGVVSNYYRPLTTLSYAIDRAIWGLNPVGFHMTNTLMHVLGGVVLYLLLEELGGESQGLGEGKKKITKHQASITKQIVNSKFQTAKLDWLARLDMPFWVALFFIIHPIQTEAVTYINSRGDSFYALLLFCGLYLFVKSMNNEQKTRNNEQQAVDQKSNSKNQNDKSKFKIIWESRNALLACSIVLYGLAILAKEIAVVGIGIFLLVLLVKIFQKSKLIGQSSKTQLKVQNLLVEFGAQVWAVGAMVGALGSYLLLRLTVLNFDNSLNFYGEVSNPYADSLWVRLLTWGKIFWTYPRLLLWPYPLHMERTSEVFVELNWWFVTMVVALVVIPVVGWREWRKKRTVWIWFGYGWYVMMMMPVSGIVAINGLIYEHWLYVPMVGFLIFIFGIFNYINHQSPIINKIPINKMTNYMLVGLSLVCVVLTLRQNWVWGDAVRFYEYTMGYGESVRLYNNLGMAYADKGRFEDAVLTYSQAVSYADVNPHPHHNLGEAYVKMGEYDMAEREYQRAIEMDPGFYYSYGPLANLYMSQGKYEEALQVVEEVLVGNPQQVEYLLMKGMLFHNLDEDEEAKKVWRQAVYFSGRDPEVVRMVERWGGL